MKAYHLSIVIIVFIFSAFTVKSDELVKAPNMLDISGIVWVEGDKFIGIHDAKNNPEKKNWPRVTLLQLPKSELDGVIRTQYDLKFPGPGGTSSDMESAASIPGGGFLFVESGQEGEGHRRIFHAVYAEGKLSIASYINWPVEIKNVEATEVHKVGDKMVFLYAERAQDMPETMLRWAELSLNPLSIGSFSEVTYSAKDPTGNGARPIVALDLDSEGNIYSVAAFDSGSDDGPYRSVVWKIGQLAENKEGKPEVKLSEPERIATLDSLKVESIAVVEAKGGTKRIYVGTDDEHYGGILRLLPASD
ncbi:MAG: hypothetical protein GWO07_14200 [Candidatus Dadabacteria bacterium]|nr:hypothetical protein [Candidatus Dadabacteria bacterium]